MSFTLLERLWAKTLVDSVSTPNNWRAIWNEEAKAGDEVYPQEQPMAGTVLLMAWKHNERDEVVTVGMPGEADGPFGIDIEKNKSCWHAHGAETLSGCMQAASMAMYMLNHFSSTESKLRDVEHRNNEKDQYINHLEGKVAELEEGIEAHRKRADQLENKNEMLRSQMGTLVNTVSSGYDEGNWHGMVKKPQTWRPPMHRELVKLVNHIDRHWYGNDTSIDGECCDEAKNVVSESYIIVLEDYRSVVTGVEDKALFMLHKTDGCFGMFLFNEGSQSMKEVEQRPEMVSDDPQGDVVVSFQNDG